MKYFNTVLRITNLIISFNYDFRDAGFISNRLVLLVNIKGNLCYITFHFIALKSLKLKEDHILVAINLTQDL